MFAAERLKLLRSIIYEQKRVEVGKLSQMFNVSEVTIRRDLELLEEEKLIERTHGGAILRGYDIDSSKYVTEEKSDQSLEEIAEVASCLVEENDIIMLINGKISTSIASKIKDRKKLTILTNDFNIASMFSENPNIRLVMLGGDLLYDNQCVYGPLTNENINSFNFNKLFIEVDGVNQQLQFTVFSSEKAALLQHAMKNSEQNIVLCSEKSFDRPSFYKIGSLEIANKVISNTCIPDYYKKQIFEENIPLYTSVNIYEGRI